MDPYQLAQLLNDSKVRGEIIKSLTFVEWQMDSLIECYFTRDARREAFSELIIDRLNFNSKISVIEKLPFKKRYKSMEAFRTIRHLQQLRNVVAHARHFSGWEEKIQNPKWAYLMEDYPKSFKNAVVTSRLAIGKLTNTKEVWGPYASTINITRS